MCLERDQREHAFQVGICYCVCCELRGPPHGSRKRYLFHRSPIAFIAHKTVFLNFEGSDVGTNESDHAWASCGLSTTFQSRR